MNDVIKTEPNIPQAQQPVENINENSQSSLTNGLTGAESGQDSDTGYVNSPKKDPQTDPAKGLQPDMSGNVPVSTNLLLFILQCRLQNNKVSTDLEKEGCLSFD